MYLSIENLSQFEIAVIVLLVTILIVLMVFALHLQKYNKEKALKSDEQARLAEDLQYSFRRTRNELTEAQNNTQTKMEQRFGEVQMAIEKRARRDVSIIGWAFWRDAAEHRKTSWRDGKRQYPELCQIE